MTANPFVFEDGTQSMLHLADPQGTGGAPLLVIVLAELCMISANLLTEEIKT
jgi:hypothetical protein